MTYPSNCIKGILNSTYLLEDGKPAPHLFYFEESKHLRKDGWVEQSINWEDDENAIDFTLTQKKEDGSTIKFTAGVTILPTEALDFHKRKNIQLRGRFSYERSPLTDNKYHGNLLLARGIPKLTMQMLASSLALNASDPVKKS